MMGRRDVATVAGACVDLIVEVSREIEGLVARKVSKPSKS